MLDLLKSNSKQHFSNLDFSSNKESQKWIEKQSSYF